jgi:hypothetical protein
MPRTLLALRVPQNALGNVAVVKELGLGPPPVVVAIVA